MGYRLDTFHVPTGEESSFLDIWRSEGAGRLYRPVRTDAGLPFLALACARDGEYEVVHEQGDVDGAGGVMLFARPQSAAAWLEARALVGARRGFIGARLLRSSVDAGSVAVMMHWSSPLMIHRAASDPGIGSVVAGAVYKLVT